MVSPGVSRLARSLLTAEVTQDKTAIQYPDAIEFSVFEGEMSQHKSVLECRLAEKAHLHAVIRYNMTSQCTGQKVHLPQGLHHFTKRCHNSPFAADHVLHVDIHFVGVIQEYGHQRCCMSQTLHSCIHVAAVAKVVQTYQASFVFNSLQVMRIRFANLEVAH